MATIVTAEEAVRHVRDGSTVIVVPAPLDAVTPAFGRLFEQTGSPRNLTVVWSAGIGPLSSERRGMNCFAIPGMLRRVIAGHVGLNHEIVKMIVANECECYILPQGIIAQLYREVAAGRPGVFSKIGIGTFVDPRIEGGKANERTRTCEDLVRVVVIDKTEYLHYKSFRADVAIIRGTSVDPHGNITNEDEPWRGECLEAALAAHNGGGIVIAQVESVSERPALPHDVFVPGMLVDYVVVAKSKREHMHTLFVEHDPSYTGRVPADLAKEMQPIASSADRIICRRAALELKPGMIVNLGIGIPMGVAQVAFEKGMLDKVTLTNELGTIGGLPQGGKNFGPTKNPVAYITQSSMFDFYDGGGLDITYVGMAQVDRDGNVNVSKFGPKIVGCGGFIDITQSAQKCVFCGEFRAVGLVVEVRDGRLSIVNEGKVAKFVNSVEQITFSGGFARQMAREVLYVTERCVFRMEDDGVVLAEVAPGIDIERDILDRMAFRPIVPDEVPLMAPEIFQDVS